MDVVLAGSNGLIGGALVRALRERGDTVRRLVRGTPRADDELAWDPSAGVLDPAHLEGADALVNLGGAGIGDERWSSRRKHVLLTSRVGPTSLLARTLGEVEEPPLRWLQASAVGWYGDRGDDELTEVEPAGEDFLGNLVSRWEAATTPARDAGVAAARLRTGIVLSAEGGALGRLLPLVRSGIAGPMGSGRQWWPWITLTDEVRAILHLLDLEAPVDGPVNLVAPEQSRNKEVVRALAHELHRPALVPVPRFALRAAVGGFGPTLTDSQRVLPTVLEASGFTYSHPTLAEAAHAVARGEAPEPVAAQDTADDGHDAA